MMSTMRAMLTHSTNFYSVVLFDPILTPLFTAILGGGGITIFGATFSYASIATAIASTAITFGLQYLLSPKPPKPEDGKAARAQAIPPRIYGVGTNRKAGYYMTWEAKGAYLYAVLALCGHPISAVNTIYLHDEPVTRTGLFVNAGTDGRYSSNLVQIDTRLGAVPETAYSFITAGLSADGVYTAAHRGDGQASLGMRCQSTKAKYFQRNFPFGIPQPSTVSDDALVWDFRDPAQSPTDRSTWTFSKNPVLCFYWHNCFNPYYGKFDYQTALLPILEEMKAEANICDDLIPRASGGTERRYECNGWATTETDPKAVTNAIKASADGWSVYRGDGVLEFRVGLVREELIYTLNVDEDVVGHSIDEDMPEEDEINRLVPRFNYPATDYTVSDTDFFENTADQLISGGILSQEIDLTWVQNWRQARRVAGRNWKRIQQKRRGSFDVRLSGINAIYSRWVRLQSTKRIPRLNGKLVENMRSNVAIMQGGFQMQWVQSPEDIDIWNPATDEGAAPPVPAKPTASEIEQPSIDTLLAVGANGSVYLRVILTEPTRDDLTFAIRYRIKDIGGSVPGEWVEQRFADWTAVSGLVTVNTSPVPNGQVLEVQAALIGPAGTYSAWTSTQEITAVADTVAPSPINTLVATGGAGQVAFTWNSPNSANYGSTAFYRNTVNNEGSATLVRTEFGPASSPDAWTDTALASGTYYYWLRARNGSLVESTSVASGAKTVT
jgi:hypothetical protein